MEMDAAATPMPPEGFFYDDLHAGFRFPEPAGVRVDEGLCALYTAISGDGLRLTLDASLCEAVTGSAALLANPALVMHISIGASTVATRNVIGNLFYRNVVLADQVHVGTTLRTTTWVKALADASPKPGRPPRGKALLGIHTATPDGATVVDYERCPLLPCRGTEAPGHSDEIGAASGELSLDAFVAAAPTGWDLTALGPSDSWEVGATRTDLQRDVVDMATALVRMTHNQAAVHRDVEVSPYDGRLVYGGHTIALGQASLARVLPGLATVVGWHACSHTAPVFEGDLLASRHTLLAEAEVTGGRLRAVRVEVDAIRDGEATTVLDWTPVVLTT